MGRKKKDADDQGSNDFPKKWKDKLPENWAETAQTYDNETLKKKIVEYESAISSTEKDQEADADLTSLKEEVKEKSKVYKESISSCQACIRYSVYLLEQRGQC